MIMKLLRNIYFALYVKGQELRQNQKTILEPHDYALVLVFLFLIVNMLLIMRQIENFTGSSLISELGSFERLLGSVFFVLFIYVSLSVIFSKSMREGLIHDLLVQFQGKGGQIVYFRLFFWIEIIVAFFLLIF